MNVVDSVWRRWLRFHFVHIIAATQSPVGDIRPVTALRLHSYKHVVQRQVVTNWILSTHWKQKHCNHLRLLQSRILANILLRQTAIRVKFPASDVPIFRWKNFDVRYQYRCLPLWILVYFCTVYVCFVLFPTDVTTIKRCGMTCLVRRTCDHRNNDYVTMFSHWRPAACQGLAAMRYWCGQWAVRVIECTPPSDYYISAHWRYRFSDVQFSSDTADVRCANWPNSIQIIIELSPVAGVENVTWSLSLYSYRRHCQSGHIFCDKLCSGLALCANDLESTADLQEL